MVGWFLSNKSSGKTMVGDDQKSPFFGYFYDIKNLPTMVFPDFRKREFEVEKPWYARFLFLVFLRFWR